MVRVLFLSAESQEFDPGQVKPNTIKSAFAASPLCFVFRNESKDLAAQSQKTVSY